MSERTREFSRLLTCARRESLAPVARLLGGARWVCSLVALDALLLVILYMLGPIADASHTAPSAMCVPKLGPGRQMVTVDARARLQAYAAQ